MSMLCLASSLCRSPELANAAFDSWMWSGKKDSGDCGSCESSSSESSFCESRSTVSPLASLSAPSSMGVVVGIVRW